MRLLCPWDFLGKNTAVGYHFLLQGIFLTQDWIHISRISCTGRCGLYCWATREARASVVNVPNPHHEATRERP